MLTQRSLLPDAPGRVLGEPEVPSGAGRRVGARSVERPRSDARRAPSSPGAIARLTRIVTIPHVVDLAAGLSPSARLRHVVFVGSLAFGCVEIDRRVVRRFAEEAYRAATRTGKRIVSDLSRADVWEEWEGRYLLCACAAMAGQLRVALSREPSPDDLAACAS